MTPLLAVTPLWAFQISILPPVIGSGDPFDPATIRFGAPAAAGLAIIALAVTPVLVPPDPVRLGLGLLLLIEGVTLLQAGLGGAPEALEQLAIVAALVAVAAGVAALSRTLDERLETVERDEATAAAP